MRAGYERHACAEKYLDFRISGKGEIAGHTGVSTELSSGEATSLRVSAVRCTGEGEHFLRKTGMVAITSEVIKLENNEN